MCASPDTDDFRGSPGKTDLEFADNHGQASMTNKLVVAMTTCANQDEAERLARLLVEQRLVACAMIGQQVRSIYPWDGQIEIAQEAPLTVKTMPAKIPALKRAIEKAHPYSVPELLIFADIDCLKPYAEWVRDWVSEPASETAD